MRVILVDSGRTVRLVMSQLIRGGSHEVFAFAEAKDALEHLKADPEVRTIVTGARLDGTSGAQLCAAARVPVGVHRSLYIIVMSASDDQRLIVEALDQGADDLNPQAAESG